MRQSVSEHLRSNVIGYIALFCFAMSGVAGALPGKNKVDSGDIKNGKVKSVDVLDNGLTGADIDDATLTVPASGTAGGDLAGTFPNPTIGPGAVGATAIADGAVGGAAIADGGVGAAEVADGSVGASDLGADSVKSSAVANGTLTGDDVAGETLTGAEINEDSLDSQPRGSFGEQGPACQDDNGTGTICASKLINLPRLSRVLIIGTATATPIAFDDVTGSNAGGDGATFVQGECFLLIDNAQVGNGTSVYQGSAPPAPPLVWQPMTLTAVTNPQNIGNHTIAIRCREADGDVDFIDGSVAYVQLNDF